MKTLQTCLSGFAVAFALAGAALFGTGIMRSDVATQQNPPATAQQSWTEVKWPFLMDQWGLGRAFRCAPHDCGNELHVYVRAKIGFCNCTTGVSDDEEIDRIGDVELIGVPYKSIAAGAPVIVAGLNGRLRHYRVTETPSAGEVLVVAFANKCDVMVATAAPARPGDRVPEDAVLKFLDSALISSWALRDLGA